MSSNIINIFFSSKKFVKCIHNIIFYKLPSTQYNIFIKNLDEKKSCGELFLCFSLKKWLTMWL